MMTTPELAPASGAPPSISIESLLALQRHHRAMTMAAAIQNHQQQPQCHDKQGQNMTSQPHQQAFPSTEDSVSEAGLRSDSEEVDDFAASVDDLHEDSNADSDGKKSSSGKSLVKPPYSYIALITMSILQSPNKR